MTPTVVPEIKGISTGVEKDVVIYAHSQLLFWWPVWAVGFLMTFWIAIENEHMILVTETTVVRDNQVIVPEGETIQEVFVHMSKSRLPGVIFTFVLLWVIISTHLWLRGVWALFITMSIVAFILLVSWLQLWETFYRWFNLLHIHISLGGYLVISTVLFVAWAVTFFLLDRRTYLIFSTGQIRVRDELGHQEQAFDTGSVVFEKCSSDWFRWLVGWGAGDMILRVGGPRPQTIELNNVIRVGKWMREMEERLRTRDVV